MIIANSDEKIIDQANLLSTTPVRQKKTSTIMQVLTQEYQSITCDVCQEKMQNEYMCMGHMQATTHQFFIIKKRLWYESYKMNIKEKKDQYSKSQYETHVSYICQNAKCYGFTFDNMSQALDHQKQTGHSLKRLKTRSKKE